MKPITGVSMIWLLIGGFFLFQAWPALQQFGGAGMSIGDTFPLIYLEKMDEEAIQAPIGSGDVVVLNVWATWCAPCRKELPMLQQLSNSWDGRGVRVLLANEEITAKSRVVEYLQSAGIRLPSYFLTSGESRKLGGVGVVPTTFIVDQKGKLINRYNGLVSRAELESVIVSLVGEKAGLKQK